MIVSDCDAVGDAWSAHHYSANASQAAAQGIQAGCDLDCGTTYKAANLQAALDAGLMTEDDLNQALERVMIMRFNLGLFDAASVVPYTKLSHEVRQQSLHNFTFATQDHNKLIVVHKGFKQCLRSRTGPRRGSGIDYCAPKQ